jgi:hypothetical protein
VTWVPWVIRPLVDVFPLNPYNGTVLSRGSSRIRFALAKVLLIYPIPSAPVSIIAVTSAAVPA